MQLKVGLGVLLLSLIGACANAEPAKGVAVVELFTSEGCSSCPPADALLSRLHKDAEKSGTPVYTLAFHVDYWNRLGWMDRFSDAAYTQRQEAYAHHFKLDSIYTPQMIVNGRTEFNGADSSAAKGAIATAVQAPAIPLTLTSKLAGGQCAIDYSCPAAADSDIINIAIVEESMTTDVKAGENAGRHLNHATVVRSFTHRPPTASRQDHLMVDLHSIDPSNASVVVYVQDAAGYAVRGAAATSVTPKP